jgi:hypothetical protein
MRRSSPISKQIQKTHHSPLPGVPNVRGFCVTRTRGTTRRTQRFERRELYAWDLDRDETRWWCGVDIDNRPVGNPKRRCDEHSSKSSLSYETKVYQTIRRKNQT